MIWIIALGTTVAFTWSWALDFATFLGVDSLVLLLSYGTSDTTAIDSTDGSNWQVVVLLRSQIVLIQNKFALFV